MLNKMGSRAGWAVTCRMAAHGVVVVVGTTLALLAVTGCPPPESAHPFTTREWMRGEWVGPIVEDGLAPVRLVITAHEIRFSGSRTLELLSVPHSEVVVSITTARSTDHEYSLTLLTTEGEIDLLFRRLDGVRLLLGLDSRIRAPNKTRLTGSFVFFREA